MASIKITLTAEECKESIAFGREIISKNAQSKRDFGSRIIREEADNLVDIIEGKLAEVGFAKFFKNKTGGELLLDFKIYPDNLTIDYGQDLDKLIVNGESYHVRCRVDIKATRMFSKWLLVESHKFWADGYILVKVDVPTDSESNHSKFLDFLENNGVTVHIVGFAYHFDIIDNETKEPFILFKQGEKLFKPDNLAGIQEWTPKNIRETIGKNPNDFPVMNVTLKSPVNFGLPVFKLRSSDDEWTMFAKWIYASSCRK